MPTAGTCRPSSVTSVARGRSSPCCISWRTRIEPMLQNISCASPVAASTATLTPGISTRASCPCETLASSSRSRRRNDCDCAVMRASIRHLLLNRVLPPTAHPGSCARGVPPSRGCNRTGRLGYHITFVPDRPSCMTTRPRLTRPPRILIASDQNHALWDLEGTLGRQGYSVLRVFAGTAVLARARAACPDVILLDTRLADSVGRVGLTEFAVVAPGANRLGARRLAQRLQGAGAAHNGGNGDGTGNGDGAGVLELRAGYDSLRQLRTAAIEPRRLLGRAARALEMARAEGKWLREGARARES